MRTTKKLAITIVCKNMVKWSVVVALLLPQFSFLYFFFFFNPSISAIQLPPFSLFIYFWQYHCRNSFLSPTSVTSFLSSLSRFFSTFWQWCCRNSFLFSFFQISLNSTISQINFIFYNIQPKDSFCST